MLTFFPLMVQSAVPGGLGRWLLSCCAQVTMVRANADSAITGARFLRTPRWLRSIRKGSFPSADHYIFRIFPTEAATDAGKQPNNKFACVKCKDCCKPCCSA